VLIIYGLIERGRSKMDDILENLIQLTDSPIPKVNKVYFYKWQYDLLAEQRLIKIADGKSYYCGKEVLIY
jgi:hypothetical protein